MSAKRWWVQWLVLFAVAPSLVACHEDRSPKPTGDWKSAETGRSTFGSFEILTADSTDEGSVCLSIVMTPDAFADDPAASRHRYQGRDYSCVRDSTATPELLFTTEGGKYGAVALLLPSGAAATLHLADGTEVESATTSVRHEPNLFLGFYSDPAVRIAGVTLRSDGSVTDCTVTYREPLGPVGPLTCDS